MKPRTHIFLTEEIIEEALGNNNKVEIPRVDYHSAEIVGTVGHYKVDLNLLEVIKNNRQQFRAGLIGPDGYPDLITGQRLIHVDHGNRGPNTNDWLEHLWESCQTPPFNTPQVKAFVLGYLAHAPGDIFVHTFVNKYAGGKFKLGENAIKHMVLEWYIGKRTPDLTSYKASIAGVKDFIYKKMVFAKPDTHLHQTLLRGPGTKYSIPRIFSTLRNELQRDIDDYDNKIRDYNRKIDNKKRAADDCEPSDPTCSAVLLRAQAVAIEAEKQLFIGRHGPIRAYKKEWRDDVDGGLKAWPKVSHEIAEAILFNRDGADLDAAQDIAESYVEDHLISMLGAPDIAVDFSITIIDILTFIPDIEQIIDEMKADLLNYLLKRAFGMSVEDIKNYLKNPEVHFDHILNRGGGVHITLEETNRELAIADSGYSYPDKRFNYANIPFAYNTVILTKLMLLEVGEVNRLLEDLGATARLDAERPNAILGFIRSLDADYKWNSGGDRMVVAEDQSAYEQIFMEIFPTASQPQTPIEPTQSERNVAGWLIPILHTIMNE